MNQNTTSLQFPRLKHALKLRCPHCGVTPLLAKKSWFQLREGCEVCRYRYIREQGYFTGAAWVMTYTFGSVIGLCIGAGLLILTPQLNVMIVATVAGTLAAVASFSFIPYGKALWLCFDHYFHPLEARERNFKNRDSI